MEDERRFVFCVDPGDRNLAVCALDVVTRRAYMYRIDLALQLNDEGEMSEVKWDEHRVEIVARRFVDFFEHYLKRTIVAGIEIQKNRRYVVLMRVLSTLLHCLYPEFETYALSQNSMRTFFDTRVLASEEDDGGYSERKEKSVEKFRSFVGDEQWNDVARTFSTITKMKTKTKIEEKLDDVCEATLMCIYLYHNRNEIEKNKKKNASKYRFVVDKPLKNDVPLREFAITLPKIVLDGSFDGSVVAGSTGSRKRIPQKSQKKTTKRYDERQRNAHRNDGRKRPMKRTR